MRAAQDAVGEVAQAGRVRTGGTATSSAPGQAPRNDDLITRVTGAPGGTPEGHPTRIEPGQDDEVKQSLALENSGAAILADHGYRIKQNPSLAEIAQARHDTGDTGRPTSRPDYLIEGRVFDCYSPTKPTKKARGIWSEVEEKVVDNQTQRVVVNLENWRGDMSTLHQQFGDWPIDRLKELKAITPDGDIVQILPRPEND
jgi:hypothetical protein